VRIQCRIGPETTIWLFPLPLPMFNPPYRQQKVTHQRTGHSCTQKCWFLWDPLAAIWKMQGFRRKPSGAEFYVQRENDVFGWAWCAVSGEVQAILLSKLDFKTMSNRYRIQSWMTIKKTKISAQQELLKPIYLYLHHMFLNGHPWLYNKPRISFNFVCKRLWCNPNHSVSNQFMKRKKNKCT